MTEGEGTRYIGDVIFDRLTSLPDFTKRARELIAADWRTGTDSFRRFADPLVKEVFEVGGFKAWGDYQIPYLEQRVMGALSPRREPWLWAYANLTGAHIAPEDAREALNRVQNPA